MEKKAWDSGKKLCLRELEENNIAIGRTWSLKNPRPKSPWEEDLSAAARGHKSDKRGTSRSKHLNHRKRLSLERVT